MRTDRAAGTPRARPDHFLIGPPKPRTTEARPIEAGSSYCHMSVIRWNTPQFAENEPVARPGRGHRARSIRRRRADGTSPAIAGHLGRDRKTIRAYLNGEPAASARHRRPRCRPGSGFPLHRRLARPPASPPQSATRWSRPRPATARTARSRSPSSPCSPPPRPPGPTIPHHRTGAVPLRRTP